MKNLVTVVVLAVAMTLGLSTGAQASRAQVVTSNYHQQSCFVEVNSTLSTSSYLTVTSWWEPTRKVYHWHVFYNMYGMTYSPRWLKQETIYRATGTNGVWEGYTYTASRLYTHWTANWQHWWLGLPIGTDQCTVLA